MPEAPTQLTVAEQHTVDLADADKPADDGQDTAARLVAALRDLQARHDELLHRFLDVVEERRALDKALFAERFKTAGLQRDLGVFQRQWHAAQTSLIELTKVQAQNDHHKQLCLELQEQIREMREQREQLQAQYQQQSEQQSEQQREQLQAQREQLQAQREQLQAQYDQQLQFNRKLQQELHELRHSRTWRLGQRYWKLARQLRGG